MHELTAHGKSRLNWQPKAHRHFIAYPNGDEHPDQFAMVQWVENPSHLKNNPPWHWHVAWPRRFHNGGQTDSKQRAADMATAGWWAGIAAAELRDAAERPVLAFMARLEATGEFDIAAIDIERAAYRELMLVMDECTRRWRGDSTYPKTEFQRAFREVIGALSDEFYRRRVIEVSGNSG